jgi:PPOX class probable F420-dependent enzyme
MQTHLLRTGKHIASETTERYIKSLVGRTRVARLATIDSKNKPHVVPVVFVADSENYYIPLDEKPKKAKPDELKRVRNIHKNPNVALLIDKYSEDWSKLAFVLIHGQASLIGTKDNEKILLENAHRLLRQKYAQYQKVGLGELCIKIHPQKIVVWKMKDR